MKNKWNEIKTVFLLLTFSLSIAFAIDHKDVGWLPSIFCLSSFIACSIGWIVEHKIFPLKNYRGKK
jgi:hypothetical protein